MLVCLFVLTCLFPPPSSWCAAPPESTPRRLRTGIHSPRVEVGLRYQGHELFLYGHADPRTTHVVAILQSVHPKPMKFVRKGKAMGLWFAVKEFEVEGLPELYMVNLTCPQCSGRRGCKHQETLNDLEEQLRPYGGIGYESVWRNTRVKRVRGKPSPDDDKVLFEGIIRLKEKEGLYAIRPNEIFLEASGMFHHSFVLPDGAPSGRYEVITYVLEHGRVLSKEEDWFTVRKSGLVAKLDTLAHRRPLAYGLLTIAVALLAGLLAGAVFKKGGGH